MKNDWKFSRTASFLIGILCLFMLGAYPESVCGDDNLDKLIFTPGPDVESGFTIDHYTLEGYTQYWYEFHGMRYRYAGLYGRVFSEPRNEVRKIEDNIRKQLILEELWIQKGFVARLAESQVITLANTTAAAIDSALAGSSVLITGTDRNPAIEQLLNKIPEEIRFRRTRAFYLEGGTYTLFVIASHTKEEGDKLKDLVERTVEFTKKYTMYKGITGMSTNYFSLCNLEGNPLDIIDTALNLRCSWILVSGYNDIMTPAVVKEWLDRIEFDYIFEPGQDSASSPERSQCVMYGMDQYPAVQDNTLDECYKWTREHDGYIFGRGSLAKEKEYDFDGYVVGKDDPEKTEKMKKPFITSGSDIGMSVPPIMVLLLDKDTELTRENLFKAILDRRCVGVFSDGEIIGPREFIEPLWILTMDRVYLDREFAESADIYAKVKGENLQVLLRNKQGSTLNAELIFDLPKELSLGDNVRRMAVSLNAWEQRAITLPISYTNQAAGKLNPIAVTLDWGANRCSSITYIDVPPAVVIHHLMLVDEGKFSFPITLCNSSKNDSVDVRIEIFSDRNRSEPVLFKAITVDAPHARETTIKQVFMLKQGKYSVKVKALENVVEGRISVKKISGKASVHLEDMNGDGINEIVMENDQIRASILLTGGRVIEYILKSQNENLLFKLWPDTPPLHDIPGGRRRFYPYGGLEEFIGQPTIETHIIFKHKILKSSGPFVQVKVWANMHGNIVEKIITLRGDSTVLEVLYAFRNMHKTLNIIGINPLVDIGPSTGPEDVYYFPVGDEIEERRPRLEKYYGNLFHVTQGWAAGEDTEMNVSLVVAYPVDAALFMHYWSNHPNNTPTPYFYTELQPWIRIKHGTTTYFTYYLFGHDGTWKEAVSGLGDLGLVTHTKRR